MFCPRCGRPVSDIANFCGGCGLPRAEIEKANSNTTVAPQIVNNNTVKSNVDTDRINSEIEKLENDLSGVVSVNDYTTEVPQDTNNITAPGDFIQQEIKEEQENPVEIPVFKQSDYSFNRPKHYNYTENTHQDIPQWEAVEQDKNRNLSTVDYIWMMLISSLPFVGTMYLLWLAFIQKENVNKQSFARAVLIIALFSFALVAVFAMGLIITQVSMFY